MAFIISFPFCINYHFFTTLFYSIFYQYDCFEGYFENQSILTYYVIGIIAIVIINFYMERLFWAIKLKKERYIRCKKGFSSKKKRYLHLHI
jgi:hypothetical protein